MPLNVNPLLAAALRRHWPVLAALGVVLVFGVLQLAWFLPMSHRYRDAVERASQLGMAVDPDRPPPSLSPRLFALFAGNTLDATVAQNDANSGALTAKLLEDVTRLAGRNGLEVLSAEQGQVVQQPDAVQVHAHLKMQGGYRGLVAMLDDIAREGQLIAIDRFVLGPSDAGHQAIELWVSRHVLKQTQESR